MKTLAELQAIRDKMHDKVALRSDSGEKRVVVGMATCGIAAGARPVLNAFVDGVNAAGLAGSIPVTQTGCIGMCRYEPIVEVYVPGQEKVTYIHMTEEKAARVVAEHIINNKPVTEYTIGSEAK